MCWLWKYATSNVKHKLHRLTHRRITRYPTRDIHLVYYQAEEACWLSWLSWLVLSFLSKRDLRRAALFL